MGTALSKLEDLNVFTPIIQKSSTHLAQSKSSFKSRMAS
jgi:hypothetical protein